MKKILYSSLFVGTAFLEVQKVAFAVVPPTKAPVIVHNETEFLAIFDKIAGFIFAISMTLSVLAVLYAAFTFLTSGGNPEKVKVARQMITYVVVGVVVAVLAGSVPVLVRSIIGGTTGG